MIIRRFIICFLCTASLAAQNSISFYQSDLSTALAIAEREGKGLFIDTYTHYCQPCKILEKELRDPELARYFNDNFINVRVDMESDKAQAYQDKYQVVFLPTILFLGAKGNLRMKIDHLISAKDLLRIAQRLNGQKPMLATTTKKIAAKTAPTTIKKANKEVATQASPQKSKPRNTSPTTNAPFRKSANSASNNDDDGKIIYVMGQDEQDLPPEILRKEAYFRMQLMDGSHKESAKKYLNSQSDWSTETNMKFLHDFVDDARSPEFEYIISNRSAFEKILNKELINQTISILVNKELSRAFPRPDQARASKLYSYLGVANHHIQAKQYVLHGLFDSGRYQQFSSETEAFLDKNDTDDHLLLHRFAFIQTDRKGLKKKQLRKALSAAERSVAQNDTDLSYYITLAQIAIRMGKKDIAESVITKANHLISTEKEKAIISNLQKGIDKL